MKYDEMITDPGHREWLENGDDNLATIINTSLLTTFGRDQDIKTYCGEDQSPLPPPKWLTPEFERKLNCTTIPGDFCYLVIGYSAGHHCLMLGLGGHQSAIPVYFYTDD